jgi:hypothetical protein
MSTALTAAHIAGTRLQRVADRGARLSFMRSLRKHPLLEQSLLPICGRIPPARAPDMAAITYPIIWLMETLRQRRSRERQRSIEELTYETTAVDDHHQLNSSFWFFPPPC